MKKNYPWFDIYWDDEDIRSVSNVIKRGSFWAVGLEIPLFEKRLQEFFGMKHALVLNSGTSALHALLLAYGITKGNVIVPSFSFIATVNCVVLAGAEPRFADIETESFGLDINDVVRKIDENTKAIIVMHYAGFISKNIKKLRKLADEKGILLIEDNAESFGAKLDGRYSGTFGHSSILSFCQNKVLPTGEGGAVLTNNSEIYEKIKLLRSHGRVEDDKINYFETIQFMDYIDVGYNYRMSSITAALGLSQMKKIDKLINLRKKKGELYDKLLSEISEIEVIEKIPNSECVYQFYAFLVKNSKDREPLRDYLKENGIFTKVQFEPIHLKSSFKNKFGSFKGYLPKTEEISKKVISIPFSLNYTNSDFEYIVNKIRSFWYDEM
ncbi:DegT/DnrJ/EryC1/StrS family aminotransferase [Candidatus Harpocratesius sp.]